LKQAGSKSVYSVSQLLSLFEIEKDEIGIREASHKLGMLPGSLHRLFASMETVGFLEKTPDRKYRLGERLFELGALFPLHSPLRKVVRPHAEDLARRFQLNVRLAIPSHVHLHYVITIDRIENLESHPLIQRISLNVPIYCSSVGKAILSFSDPETEKRILKDIKLVRYTKNTITSMKKLQAEIAQIRKNGYAVDRGEEYENVYCVAVPLFRNEKLVGALSLSESPERMKKRNIPELARALMERASFISRQL
jgi:DNA-binding IclR family transcriptional regulator